MAFDFSRAVHEPYECTIAPAPVGDLFQSIPYYLPVRCSSLPPQDRSAYIDAAIAIRDGLEEVDAMFWYTSYIRTVAADSILRKPCLY